MDGWMDGGENCICVRVEIGVVFLTGFVMREGRGSIVWCTCRTVAGEILPFVYSLYTFPLPWFWQQRSSRGRNDD